ncbi:hypothetical protein DTO271G3_2629 [Paecilomyces variotii]|nr:hypothetical protein DTO271G3_2629 [Paecilomyces variotii]
MTPTSTVQRQARLDLLTVRSQESSPAGSFIDIPSCGQTVVLAVISNPSHTAPTPFEDPESISSFLRLQAFISREARVELKRQRRLVSLYLLVYLDTVRLSWNSLFCSYY